MTLAAAPLVFDLGVCNGDDSAFYLHEGFRVVGVEANPLLIPALERRFADEIADGRYHLLNVGIAEQNGEAEFWVCDDHPEWSSFDRAIAGRSGSRHHSVRVPTCRFRAILQRFGTPFYCKVDIEGNDDLCLADLGEATRPCYISVELGGDERQIGRLAELGYSGFKIISQRTLRQPSPAMVALKAKMPPRLRRLVAAGEAGLLRHRPGQWRHLPGSSGPFGEEAHGPWQTADQALGTWQQIRRASPGLSDWFDVHARLPQVRWPPA
jgi:FkbM family methyltransferase